MVRRASQSKKVRNTAAAVIQALEDRRLLSISGALDIGFGTNGAQSLPLQTGYSLDHNYFVRNGNDLYEVAENCLMKVNSDGTLDTTFGSSGKVQYPTNGWISGVVFQSNGQILTSFYTAQETSAQIYRLTPSGSRDLSYGSLGVLSLIYGNSFRAKSLIQLPDGKFMVGGDYKPTSIANTRLGLVELYEDGSLNPIFGLKTYIPAEGNYVNLIGISAALDHVMPVLEINTPESILSFSVARISLQTGELDTTYSGDGYSDSLDDGMNNLVPDDFLLDSNGRMFVSAVSGTRGRIYAIDQDGYLDYRIGANGILDIPSNISNLGTVKFTLAPDNSILAGDRDSWRVMRFTSTGDFDANYDYSIAIWGTGVRTYRFDDFTFLPGGKLLTLGVDTVVSTQIKQPILVRYMGFWDSGPIITIDNNDIHPENLGLTLVSTVKTYGGRSISKYEWDFDYDGSTFDVDSMSQSPVFPMGAFPEGSYRNFALRVTDSEGNVSDVAQKSIFMGDSSPTASIAVVEEHVYANLAMTLSLSAADVDGIAQWRFDWGDGNIQTINGNPAAIQHTYSVKANYTIQAWAIDNEGTLSQVQSLTVSVQTSNSVEGYVYNDLDKDGVKDQGESGFAGLPLFVDLNSDSSWGDYTYRATQTAGLPTTFNPVSTLTYTFTLSGLPQIQSLPPKLILALTHPDLTYLSATLTKGSTSIRLFNIGDLAGKLMTNTTFSSTASTSIYNGSSPYSSTYLPRGVMSNLNSIDPNGEWKLTINNASPTDIGSLTKVDLSFTFPEPRAITDQNGRYFFTDIPNNDNNNVNITLEQEPIGFTNTLPLTPTNSVILQKAGDTYVTQFLDYGFTSSKTKSAYAFDDANSDGIKNPGEEFLPGVTLFADLNNNGVLDDGEVSADTDDTGLATITIDQYIDFVIRAVIQPGQKITALAQGTLNNNAAFGITTLGIISGSVFYDDNSDGIRQNSESGAANITVFIDANHNGILNLGETSTVTAPGGAFSFINLPLGDYDIRVAPPTNTQVSPGGVSHFNVTREVGVPNPALSFPLIKTNILSGVVYNDANADGVRQASEQAIGGILLYIDANNNGARDAGEKTATTNSVGKYLFSNVSLSQNLRVRKDEGSWRSITTLGQILAARQFNIGLTHWGSVSGTLYVDSNNNKKIDSKDRKLASTTVWIDINHDGIFNAGDLSTLSNSKGVYKFNFVPTGQYQVRVVRSSGYRFIGYSNIAFALSNIQAKNNLNFLFKKL